MALGFKRFCRKFHLWGALVIFVPVAVVIVSGILLQVKKEFNWIQPPTKKGQMQVPSLSFPEILAAVSRVEEAQIRHWQDIKRIDVRPGKGVLKVQNVNNNWEIQLDASSGKILKVAYRRSDTIEAIHDGSWFFDAAKLWIFLPVAIVLFILWITGAVMLYQFLQGKRKRYKFNRRHPRP